MASINAACSATLEEIQEKDALIKRLRAENKKLEAQNTSKEAEIEGVSKELEVLKNEMRESRLSLNQRMSDKKPKRQSTHQADLLTTHSLKQTLSTLEATHAKDLLYHEEYHRELELEYIKKIEEKNTELLQLGQTIEQDQKTFSIAKVEWLKKEAQLNKIIEDLSKEVVSSKNTLESKIITVKPLVQQN